MLIILYYIHISHIILYCLFFFMLYLFIFNDVMELITQCWIYGHVVILMDISSCQLKFSTLGYELQSTNLWGEDEKVDKLLMINSILI